MLVTINDSGNGTGRVQYDNATTFAAARAAAETTISTSSSTSTTTTLGIVLYVENIEN